MSIRNLPSQPFQRLPLVWASPPTGDDLGPVINAPATPNGQNQMAVGDAGVGTNSSAISTVTFSYNNLAGSVNTAFPNAILAASQLFAVPVGIVSITLSSSIKNATTDGVVGLFVARNLGPALNLNVNSDTYVEHLVTAGLSHSMRSGSVFADDVALKIASNESIALYVSAAGTGFAGNLITAIVNIRYFSLT